MHTIHIVMAPTSHTWVNGGAVSYTITFVKKGYKFLIKREKKKKSIHA